MAHIAKKVKKLATVQLYNLKVLLNGRGLSNFKKCYAINGELGHGGFGVVYRGIRICDELPVAIKFIDRNQVHNWGKLEDERLPMEICMLARCVNVPGVIKLLDWYSIPEGFLIVMIRPYPCVDLFDFIKSQKKLDEDLARFLFRQIALTLQKCAKRKVLHRDVKDENIVIDLVNGETSLIDFGAATLLKKNYYTDFQGTRLYCPPEWFLHSMYLGREAAVWSLGTLLYNMLNGRLPFRSEKEICTSNLLGPLPFHAQVSKSAMDLINQCLCFEPNKRCTLDTILQHSWTQAPCDDWFTLINRTFQQPSSDDQQYDVMDNISNEQPESSYDESGVGSTSSFIPSTSCSFMRRYCRVSQEAGGTIAGLPSHRSHGYQHWNRIRTCQSKPSLTDDSPSPKNTRQFMRRVHLQQNNPVGRMNKEYSINYLSDSARFIFPQVQNPDDSDLVRFFALAPLIRKKDSMDSGRQSAVFLPAALLSESSSPMSFNEKIGEKPLF